MKTQSTSRLRVALLVTTTISSLSIAGAALAQAAEAGNSAQTDQNQLEEVVVTATRQTDTVNRVPLAVTAQTQRSLDQQGVRSVRDLESLVPSLQTSQNLASGAAQFSIRGIVQSGQGAATTGFYLDDTPLQKRNVGGGVATSNGTPLPPLFDLDRVEVLRGPQGTLFGGGSEGGTIRYIQPAPSLTRYSSYARAQYSIPKKGDASYEGGIAVGGPIIQDKLGFRASVFAKNSGGFIDLIDPYTKKEIHHNSNSGKTRMMRGALTWAPTERMRITADYFSSSDDSDDVSSSYTQDLPNAVVVPTTCYNLNNTPLVASGQGTYNAAGFNTNPRGGPVSGLANGSQSRIYPYPVARGDAACNSAAAAGDVTYRVPGFTYGPYDLDRYDSLQQAQSSSATNLQVFSLTAAYDFDKMSVKSITSYIDDQTKTNAPQLTLQGALRTNASYIDPVFGQRFLPQGPSFNPISGVSAEGQTGFFNSNNRRYGITQEVRFSSAGDAKPFSWVGGVYYSNLRGTQRYDNLQNLDFLGASYYGFTSVAQRYAVPALETAPGLFNNFDARRQTLKDVEIAAFGEANYWITDKLKATAGIRVSRVSFDYSQVFFGPVTGQAVPTAANGGANSGSLAESPVTPKFGLQYNITDNDLVYVTASKGFRAGGINAYISTGICGPALDQYGLTPQDLPETYKSDSVWSYEVGGKFRLLNNRVQLNGAAYRIDWKDTQFTGSPGFGCGLTTTYNVGGARSQGVEVEAQARVFSGFTLNGAFGYNNTKYTETSIGVRGKPGPGNNFVQQDLVLVLKDQKFALPPWNFSVGARYEFEVASRARAYIRGDYRYSRGFQNSPFGTAGYNPDSNITPSIFTANARLGVEFGDFDVNLFVNNLLDRKRTNLGGGRTGCALPAVGGTPACTVFNTYNPIRTINTGLPREIGLQIAFRH